MMEALNTLNDPHLISIEDEIKSLETKAIDGDWFGVLNTLQVSAIWSEIERLKALQEEGVKYVPRF